MSLTVPNRPPEPFRDVEAPELPRAAHRHLLRGSAWSLSAVAATALGGIAFWFIAAQVSAARNVGQAAALFTGIIFINYATNMGLQVAVARYAPDRSRSAGVLFTWAMLYTIATSAIGGALFLWVAPAEATAPVRALGSPLGFLIMFAISAGCALTNIVDIRLMTLRCWDWIFLRSATVALIRLPLLLALPARDRALWLFVIVGGVPALSGIVGGLALAHERARPYGLRPLPPNARAAFNFAWINYFAVLADQAPVICLPLIVLASVSPSTNANFYVAWGVVLVAFFLSTTIAQVLLVEGGKDGARVTHQVRLTLVFNVLVVLAAVVAAFAGREVVTEIYGSSYAEAAHQLPKLVLAGAPWAITSVAIALARVERDTFATIAVTVIFAATVLVPAALWIPGSGIDGAANAWLLGNLAAALCSIGFLSRSWQRRRHHVPTVSSVDP